MSGLSTQQIFDQINTAVNTAEQSVKDQIASISGENADDPAQIAKLQQAMNAWTVMMNAQSSVVSTIKTTSQTVLQKVN